MSRTRLFRRALTATAIAGGTTTAVALGANPAGAQTHPRISVYELTPTEWINLCGPSGPYSGVTTVDGMTLNCWAGTVGIPSCDTATGGGNTCSDPTH